jgi:hypothetical protein
VILTAVPALRGCERGDERHLPASARYPAAPPCCPQWPARTVFIQHRPTTRQSLSDPLIDMSAHRHVVQSVWESPYESQYLGPLTCTPFQASTSPMLQPATNAHPSKQAIERRCDNQFRLLTCTALTSTETSIYVLSRQVCWMIHTYHGVLPPPARPWETAATPSR